MSENEFQGNEAEGREPVEPETTAAGGVPEEESATEVGAGAAGEEARPSKAPPFHKRLIDVFFSPGRLGEALAENPVWGLALLLGAVLVFVQLALIPAEVWESIQREAILRSGREMPEMGETARTIMKWASPVFGSLGWVVMAFLFSGIVTLIFVFILGDEGRYKQYLALYSHAMLIPATVGLLLTPLRITQENPQLTINLGSFFFFLPDGYLVRFLGMMDLTQLWAWAVVGMGVHAVDKRRGTGMAVTILICFAAVLAAVFAIWAPPT